MPRLILLLALLLPLCAQAQDLDLPPDEESPVNPPLIGDAQAGARLIREVGCGSCHHIPGIDGADSYAAPPLDRMSRRRFIAGMLHNTPSNMVVWLLDPQEVVPGNAMPDVGFSEAEAQDVAAYLFTLD